MIFPDPGTEFFPSRIQDPGVKKAPDPGSGSATLVFGSKMDDLEVIWSPARQRSTVEQSRHVSYRTAIFPIVEWRLDGCPPVSGWRRKGWDRASPVPCCWQRRCGSFPVPAAPTRHGQTGCCVVLTHFNTSISFTNKSTQFWATGSVTNPYSLDPDRIQVLLVNPDPDPGGF